MATKGRKRQPAGAKEAENRIATASSDGATILDLSNLGLTALPEALGQLTQLQRLDVWNNQLTALPEALGQLTRLQRLDVSGNHLSALPEALGQLTQLEELDISDNQLTTLPEVVCNLTELELLILSENKLGALPEALGKLTGLRWLVASSNQLTALPEALDKLNRLQQLYISHNQLTALPASLAKLTQLQLLEISANRLRSLPMQLRDFTALEALYLHKNSELSIPDEILGPTFLDVRKRKVKPADPKVVLEYYFKVRDSRRPLNEAKLVLVGFGGVGKTSLVKRLIQDRFDPKEKMTDGIAIADWPVPLQDAEVRVHVWDFGGQEIMHATHQFFLTHRSLYLVVLNGRQGREDADAEYWLNLIASFGGDSPVIVVLNKIKEHPFDVNRAALRQKFPMVRGVFATDCADPPEGRPLLIAAIQREIDALPGLRDAFPAAWFAIKSLTRNELSDFSHLWLVGVASNDGVTRCRGLKPLAASISAVG